MARSELSRAAANARLLKRLHHEIGLVPDYEGLLDACYSRLIEPGQVVLDIGAHGGRHTRRFSTLVGPMGRVHAFEPLPAMASALRALPWDGEVIVHELAVSAARGPVAFVHATGTPEESGLRRRVYNDPAAAQPVEIMVEARPLDDLRDELGAVGYIKIDVEGAEIDVLSSAERILAAHRPWISVEYGWPSYSAYGRQARDLYDRAAALGYRIADLFGGVCADLEDWLSVCDVAYWDWVLAPAERIEEWERRMAWPRSLGALAAEAEAARLAVENARLAAELAALRASTSWRATGPLRAAVVAARRILGRPPRG